LKAFERGLYIDFTLGCIDTFHGVFYNKIKKLAFKRKIAMKIPKDCI
jgi:hypothetical protein